MKLLACNSNKILSQEIAKYLGVELVNADVKKFADNEIFVEIKENVRGEDIFGLKPKFHEVINTHTSGTHHQKKEKDSSPPDFIFYAGSH